MKNKMVVIVTIVILLLVQLLSGCFEDEKSFNKKPTVVINYPETYDTVSKIVTISGEASDPNGDRTIKSVEIMINDSWISVDGTDKWIYSWNTYELDDGSYTIYVRAWDGDLYSDTKEVTITVNNPDVVESNSHKWAIFTFVGNFPDDNESKLGNGGLYLAEEIASYLIEEKSYPTSNIYILFDDGYIRKDNGLGKRLMSLQERIHEYDVFYAAATKNNFISVIDDVVGSSNKFDDSEVFLWLSGHGCGDNENPATGGKLFERSSVYLWDDTLEDNELGTLLQNLKSKKTCIVVDACFSGGFADKTIYNMPELFLFNSKIPSNGRVVITGASKFRLGYASVSTGPLFSTLWFYGLYSGDADGYKSGILNSGRPSKLNLFKDDIVSVEEAFYYARYMLKNDANLQNYSKMEPQISDRYPRKGIFGSSDGLVLG